jgi:predicted lipoprotein with Yx(FWY)xxD motif
MRPDIRRPVREEEAARYRKRGLDKTARAIVEMLEQSGVAGATVLEIGGGAGEIQLELLRRGAASVINLELSPAYEPEAAALIAEAGFTGRVQRRLVDIATDPAAVPSCDITVLHRVVCCYPDYAKLLGAAADHARRHLVFSHPPRNPVSRAVAAPTLSKAPTPAASGTALAVRQTSLGTILTDGRGFTLYAFDADKGTTSNCSGACATAWPSDTATGTDPQVGSGATRSVVGRTTRADGTTQLTYAGRPLYLFRGDSAPGSTSGDGSTAFGARWDALTATGQDATGG